MSYTSLYLSSGASGPAVIWAWRLWWDSWFFCHSLPSTEEAFKYHTEAIPKFAFTVPYILESNPHLFTVSDGYKIRW